MKRTHIAPPLVAGFIACVAPAWLWPASARAEEPDPPPADVPDPPPPAPTAADFHAQAQEAAARGDHPQACRLLRRSLLLEPSIPVRFELAECLEKAGFRLAAAAAYEQVAAAGQQRAEEARRRGAALLIAAMSDARAVHGVDEGGEGPGAAKPDPAAKPAEVAAVEAAEDDPWYSDFMDTRLTWTFGDDDLLHSTGEAVPLSPDPSIGDRKQYRMFFDNLNSRFGGRENLSHLALYKKMPSFFDRLDTEASLVLRFDLASLSKNDNNVNRALYDSGSFIRMFLKLGDDPKDDKTGLGLTFWPIDTDRYRLGYLYDISWGGTNAAINQSIFPRIQGSSPGAKLSLDWDPVTFNVGFKTATIVQVEEVLTPGAGQGTSDVEVIRVGQTNYGVLGGFGVQFMDDMAANIRLDVGGGYFQQGKFDLPDVSGEPVYTAGFSTRLVVHDKDMPAPQSIDYLLYRNDPNAPLIMFKGTKYVEDKTTWNAMFEFSHLWQNLKDFDTTGATRLQPARAAALQGNLKHGYFRMSLTGIYRDVPFVLRNVPSYIPFETVPEAADTSDEFFIALAGDYHFKSVRLTPGLGAGLQFPSTFTSSAVDLGGTTIGRTVVIRQQGNMAILPVDASSVPIFQARASLKWDVSKILSAVIWVQYVMDNNGTFVERDPNEGTVALRTFISPSFFGFGTSMQARF